MRPIRHGISARLAADATLATLGASCYHRLAPEAAEFPYVVFNQQSGGTLYAYAGRVARQTVWLIKGVSDDLDEAERIDTACEQALVDAALDVTPWRLLVCRRDQDIAYPERVGGVTVHHEGALYRIEVT